MWRIAKTTSAWSMRCWRRWSINRSRSVVQALTATQIGLFEPAWQFDEFRYRAFEWFVHVDDFSASQREPQRHSLRRVENDMRRVGAYLPSRIEDPGRPQLVHPRTAFAKR